MKKFLFATIVIVLFCLSNNAQGLYKVSYQANNIIYEGLLVWLNTGQSYMRIRYYDTNLQKYALVQQNVHYENNGFGERLRGSNAVFLTPVPAGYTYYADHFIFRQVNGFYECTHSIDDQNLFAAVREFRPLTFGEVNDSFLQAFGFSPPPVNRTPSAPTTMYLIVVADTRAPDIGDEVKLDIRNSVREFQTAAHAINISFRQIIIEGSDFTKDKVQNVLSSFSPSSNDIVIFIYSGHGFRYNTDTERYPRLNFAKNRTDPASNNLSAFEVYNSLKSKNARLLIAVFDTCNNILGNKEFDRDDRIRMKPADAGISGSAAAALFLKLRGSIIIAAADKGQKAQTNENKGSLFLQSFIDAFMYETSAINGNSPDWSTIITKAKNNAYADSKSGQTAIYSIELR